MNSQEEKWFETYTWNGEPNTRYILFRQRKYSVLIRNSVDGYLKSLGFVDQTDPDIANASNQSTMVDLGVKTYQHLSAWRMHQARVEMGTDIPLAYPSQMTIFMAKHFGAVAGHRFGL